MFNKIVRNGKFLGHQFLLEDGYAFFGSRFLLKEDLPKYFPEFQFRFLKQVHGRRVIKASTSVEEADGHWSSLKNEALVIQTADCIPLMIHDSTRIVAVHAGWRGVEQNILEEALEPIKNHSDLRIICGPFIDKNSFEVGEDVALRLLSSDPFKGENSLYPHKDPTKRRVDLRAIVTHQGKALNPDIQSEFLGIDTFSSANHCSYRRDGAGAGRLLSFIVRTNAFQIANN